MSPYSCRAASPFFKLLLQPFKDRPVFVTIAINQPGGHAESGLYVGITDFRFSGHWRGRRHLVFKSGFRRRRVFGVTRPNRPCHHDRRAPPRRVRQNWDHPKRPVDTAFRLRFLKPGAAQSQDRTVPFLQRSRDFRQWLAYPRRGKERKRNEKHQFRF